MTLRLDEVETQALRERAAAEGRSMQEVARSAVRLYIETAGHRQSLDEAIAAELPRYRDALTRLGQ